MKAVYLYVNLTTMNNQPSTSSSPNRLHFSGQGLDLFVILLVNGFLNLITLSLYYPWARVKLIKFYWENTELNDTTFVFHGTGAEVFKGYIKLMLLSLVFVGCYIYATVTGQHAMSVMLIAVFYLVLLLLVPVAVHGGFKYRLSRTSWRNVHFGYRGNRTQLIIEFLLGYLFTVLTLGIYASWFTHKIRAYVISNIRFGSLGFQYTGTGFDLFLIQLKGIFLTVLTLGIYYAWYRKEWINYLIEHTYIEQNNERYRMHSSISGGSLFGISLLNLVLVIITFGLAFPWAVTRTLEYVIAHIELPDAINFDTIQQTENEYKDATGEYLMDALDLGII